MIKIRKERRVIPTCSLCYTPNADTVQFIPKDNPNQWTTVFLCKKCLKELVKVVNERLEEE